MPDARASGATAEVFYLLDASDGAVAYRFDCLMDHGYGATDSFDQARAELWGLFADVYEPMPAVVEHFEVSPWK